MENKYVVFLFFISFISLYSKGDIISHKENSRYAKYIPHEIENITPEQNNDFTTHRIYQGQSLDSLIKDEESIPDISKTKILLKEIYDSNRNSKATKENHFSPHTQTTIRSIFNTEKSISHIKEICADENGNHTIEIYDDIKRTDGLKAIIINPQTQKPQKRIFNAEKNDHKVKEDIFNNEGKKIKE